MRGLPTRAEDRGPERAVAAGCRIDGFGKVLKPETIDPQLAAMMLESHALSPSKRRLCAVLLGLLAMMIYASPAYAAEFRGEEGTARIGANEIIYGDLFIGAQDLVIEGIVNGDVFAGATSITIRGTINGSLNGGAASVRIEGPVAHGVRIAAADVLISAPIGRDLMVAGESVEITQSGSVGGDALVAANDVAIVGRVDGRVLGFAERLRIASGIGRLVDVEIGELTVDSSARIGGDLTYRSASQAQIPPGTVAGNVIYEASSSDPSASGIGGTILGTIRWSLAWIVVQALLGLLLFGLARGWMDRAAGQVLQRPWISLLTGCVSGIAAVPAILVVSLALLVGFGIAFGGGILAAIPVPVFGLGLYALALYVSPVFAALAVGRLLLGRMQLNESGLSGIMALAVGLLVLALLGAVPYVGWLITALATLFGLGAALLAGRATSPQGTAGEA